MEAPRSTPDSSLTPHIAVLLLERRLAESEFRPSEGLRALFEGVAPVGPDYSSVIKLISSGSLFFAAAEAELSTRYEAGERQLLSELQGLIHRSRSATYQEVRDAFFRQNLKPGGGPPRLSGNVERLLSLALDRVAERRALHGELTVVDLLSGFPTESSTAEKLMVTFGIDLDEWRENTAALVQLWDGKLREQSPTVDRQEPPPVQTGDVDNEAPQSPPAPLYNDSVATHADEPAMIDLLERAPFASVLARNIIEARASGEAKASAFIVHLHGPWGAGKSSVLNFLEAKLKKADEPWLVVRFNAWRDQRRQPPWWSLITCIYAGARANLDTTTANRLWWRWFKWRVRADYLPWVGAAALLVGCAVLVVLGFTTAIGTTLSVLGAALGLLTAGAVALRSLALGSQRAAQTYAELKSDPFQPMTTLFDRLIAAIGRPVAVFIDDLDRCDSAYVVELLEGVQTLMRGAPVTYVVAADRKWICSSFEQKYAKFSPPIGEPGRPLGYLFLDKIFQVSAAVPQIAPDVRNSYWDSLLKISAGGGTNDEVRETAEAARRAADEKAQAAMVDLATHEELTGAVERAEKTKDPIAIQAARAEAAMRITSAEASAKAEHRLKDYAKLLEANPRSMKRLVNAYGMHQATLFLAGRSAPPDALARWTILELRWPLLADFVASRPNHIDRVRKPLADGELKYVPAPLRELFGDELVLEVIGDEAAVQKLDADSLRAILGAVQGDR